MRKTTIQEQLASKTQRDESTGCLLWTGARYNGRYGRVWFEGQDRLVHRVVYELNYGHIPSGMLVCHTCDVETCVEHTHLFLGTPQDNMTDKKNKGRQYRPKGERHHAARLTDSDVLAIFNDSRSHAVVAREYKVNRSLVTMIKLGKRWSHVTGKIYESQKAHVPLTDDEIRSIRADEHSHQAIADTYGVSRSLITLIKNGQRYNHVS